MSSPSPGAVRRPILLAPDTKRESRVGEHKKWRVAERHLQINAQREQILNRGRADFEQRKSRFQTEEQQISDE